MTSKSEKIYVKQPRSFYRLERDPLTDGLGKSIAQMRFHFSICFGCIEVLVLDCSSKKVPQIRILSPLYYQNFDRLLEFENLIVGKGHK